MIVMMNMIKVMMITVLIGFTPAVFAVCGSGSTEDLVPDRPLAFDFSSSCREHDGCYSTCGVDKRDCDNQFHSHMRNICKDRFYRLDPRREICLKTADGYWSAVWRMGGDAYREAQKEVCP